MNMELKNENGNRMILNSIKSVRIAKKILKGKKIDNVTDVRTLYNGIIIKT
jgi:hypothetical protein